MINFCVVLAAADVADNDGCCRWKGREDQSHMIIWYGSDEEVACIMYT